MSIRGGASLTDANLTDADLAYARRGLASVGQHELPLWHENQLIPAAGNCDDGGSSYIEPTDGLRPERCPPSTYPARYLDGSDPAGFGAPPRCGA